MWLEIKAPWLKFFWDECCSASFGQRMCKISFWCDKKKAQHKKINGMNMPIIRSPVVFRKHWGSKSCGCLKRKLHGCRFHGTATNRINRNRRWPFLGRWCLAKLVILKRQQLITSVSFLGTYHSEHSLEAHLTWHGIIMLPTLGSHFTNLIMLIMSWSSWVSDSTIKALSSSLTAEFSSRTRTLYVPSL